MSKKYYYEVSLTWEEAKDSASPAKIWEQFNKHVAPKVNYRLARYQLQQLRKTNEEFVDVFLTRCRNQTTKCRFRDKEESDESLIEQLGWNQTQASIGKKGKPLTFRAIDIARTYEAIQSQMEELEGKSNN